MKRPASKLAILVFIIISCCTALSVSGQQRRTRSPATCEYLMNEFDYALLDTKKTEGASLILIFHRGTLERSVSYSQRRAATVEKYFTSRIADTSFLVIAQGKARRGLGTIEIFVNGKLKEELAFVKNRGGWGQCIE